MKRKEDLVGAQASIEMLIVPYLLKCVERFDSSVPVLVFERAVLVLQSIDDMAATGDRVANEQEPLLAVGLA